MTPLGKTWFRRGKTWFRNLHEADFGLSLDKIDGLPLCPVLAGRQTLVFASDNNVNRNGQVSQFVVFSLDLR